MKKALSLALVIILFYTCSMAQAPQSVPYQAVVRNASGNLVQNQQVSLQFTIHSGSSGGTVVYQETQTGTAIKTNNLGLVTVNIGTGTQVGSNAFSSINWGSSTMFLDVQIDPNGGSSYTDMGTTQMMSVPYALYAANAGAASSGGTVQTTSALTGNGSTSSLLGIASHGVTYGYLQNETNNTFLGNFSGAAASPSEYTLGTGLAVSSGALNLSGVPYSVLTGTPTIPTATNYIVNGTSQQASANFNISGSGTVGGTISAGAYAILGSNTNAGYYQDANNGAYRSIVPVGTSNGYYFQNYGGATTNMYVGLDGTYKGRVGIGNAAPQRNLDLSTTGQITFGDDVTQGNATTGLVETGLFWESGTSYGIYRTGQSWASPNYAQLELAWTTGIVIDGGSAYGLSGTSMQPSGGPVSMGGTLSVAGNESVTGGTLTLNNTTSDMLFINNTAGVNPPALTTRSTGTKLVLYPGESGSAVDYGLGIDNSTLWFSVPTKASTQYFSFYGGTTKVASIDGVGDLNVAGGATIGAFTTAGTVVSSSTGVLSVQPTSSISPNTIHGKQLFSYTTLNAQQTFNCPTGVTQIWVTGSGGGGGGASSTISSNNGGTGGGGGAAACMSVAVSGSALSGAAFIVVVGNGGAGGGSAGTSGSAGGATTFGPVATPNITLGGGAGAVYYGQQAVGGAPGTAKGANGTNLTVSTLPTTAANFGGAQGGAGGPPGGGGGTGGGSMFGAGGGGGVNTGGCAVPAGYPGALYGGGGGGGMGPSGTGGAGAPGFLLIEW